MAFKSKLLTAFGTALALLACVGVLSYLKVRQDDEDQSWVEHTHSVLETIAAFQVDLAAAGTSGRAYFTTGDQANLDAYQETVSRLRIEIREIQTLTLDNPVQQAYLSELAPLLAERLSELQMRVDLRKRPGARAPAALAAVQPGSLRQTQEQIKALLAELQQEEKHLLERRSGSARTSGRQAKVAIIGGYAMALLFLLAAAVVVQHEMNRRSLGEKSLQASEKQFKGLLDSAPDAMIIVNRQGHIELINAQTEKLFGYTRDQLRGKSVDVLVPERFRANHGEHRQGFFHSPKAREMGAGLELYGLRKDGTEFPVEISLSPLQTDDGLLVSSAIRDITARKKAEEKFKALLQSAPDAMVIVNQDGAIVLVNSRTEQLFGYSSPELLNNRIEMLIPERFRRRHPGHREGFFGAPKLRPMGAGLELYGRRKDGTEFPVEISLSPLQTEEGLLVSSAIRDVTERKQTERALDDQRKALAASNSQLTAANKELESFSYSVSHDLRAPLRGIDGFSQALLEDYSHQLDDTGKQYLERVRTGAQRMAALIDDLLELSRITRTEIQRQPLDLSEMARSVASELSGRDPARMVEFVIAPGLQAEGDAPLMRTVLENLLGNAWKFTSRNSQAQIEFGCTQTNGLCTFFVRDNGAGFDPAYAGRLFGAFQRLHAATEFPGTGVGLASVQRVIHRHGGRLWAKSAVNEGATFFFTLMPDGLKNEPAESEDFHSVAQIANSGAERL